ncbi:galactokinase [Arthrospiribacter ruber]|uniref:Galactokinase n=1 Tax=Arthrospiribacter ruber TaxID=2487934 RepID=A0A951MCQ6_9BACT|nr:galactokinase [Arthrospiribacter ruber]MBW3467170.1 galactokinase [Arthrospiribacter ruber]
MKTTIQTKFLEIFNTDPLLVYSPGRINLIGEHTDYNNGFVMPAAIDKKMVVGIAKNGSRKARLFSLDFTEEFAFELDSFSPKKGHWSTYIMGVTAQLIQAGYPVEGFDMVFGGDIPVGAGLSSSAALEAAVGYGISELFEFDISRNSLIHYAQKAEHLFAGVQCGIMDQFASVMGQKDKVLRLDCRSMEFAYFPLELEDYSLYLVDTKVKHSLADSAYNQRREECERGVSEVKKLNPKIHSLRDVTLNDLDRIKENISSAVFNRCRYVIEENERVLKASDLLEKKKINAIGQLLYDSHQGLSKLYEVSCMELDWLVEKTKVLDYVLGSRMMGGGFGGCTINLIKTEKINEFQNIIEKDYYDEFGTKPAFYPIKLGAGTDRFD